MRYQEYLTDLDVKKRILEIGPLTSPVIAKNEGNVFYADRLSTEAVKEVYRGKRPDVAIEDICEIDFVIDKSYTECLAGVEKFDYVISSHVLEHMPRLIDFFQDIANVLSKRGSLYLFVPDHRYCFDRFRTPTSFGEAYYVHALNLPCPLWRVIDEKVERIACNNPYELWTRKDLAKTYLPARGASFTAPQAALDAVLGGDIGSGHFSVFSPASFILLLFNLVNAGMLPFILGSFFPTPRGSNTFGAVLQRCPEVRTNAKIMAFELDKLSRFLDSPDLA